MQYLAIFIDFILHLNTHLNALVEHMGNWSYLLFFLIIFGETGFIIFPFLPGDSLLLALGYLASLGTLDITILLPSLMFAAILGNTVNYFTGKWLGSKVFHFPRSRWFNPFHLQKAHHFYQRYGGIALIFGRFIPIVRTFVPFIAGIAAMNWRRFQFFNGIGSLAWIAILIEVGYFLGHIPIVKHHLSAIILGIIVISILLPIFGCMIQNRKKKTEENSLSEK
ncbi:VTT domain-containing protein [uncultured Shewanella sp.]|uniref:VTT domain-containing protein n=1 Tax=uncultured Shewanella sp. TaxID=173975 RepID=UPI002621BA4F|nr:VTT domain-containing protein [uncultured Shewanella sp.]